MNENLAGKKSPHIGMNLEQFSLQLYSNFPYLNANKIKNRIIINQNIDFIVWSIKFLNTVTSEPLN